MANNTYPIILAHGIARFDFLTEVFLNRLKLTLWEKSASKSRLHYFKGIVPYLRAHGFDAYATNVRFAANLNTRASDLRAEVLRVLEISSQAKVHIIGHSMGGLDARAMIVNEGMADKVASATSIGTPHLGTSFADWGLESGGQQIIKTVREFLDLGGFENLTTVFMADFNARARNEEATNAVVYRTYAAAQEFKLIFGPLQGSWKIINEREGINDGLVSVKSQRWVAELVSDEGVVKQVQQHDFPLPADHLNQVGWWDIRELLRWRQKGLLQKKEVFETAVKNAYLHIAQTASDLHV